MSRLGSDTLYLPVGPYLHVVEGGVSQSYDFGQSLVRHDSMNVVLRFLRGRKMRDANGLDNEFAAALQFPWYYGENWAAFDECLNDLNWLPAETYLLFILNSDEILITEDEEQFSVLVRILQETGEEWGKPVEASELWSRPAIPFHVLLHTEISERQKLISRLDAAGAVYDIAPHQ